MAPWEKIQSVLSHPIQVSQYKIQTADYRLGTKRRLRTKTVSRLLRDMLSKNILFPFSAVIFHQREHVGKLHKALVM